MSASKRLIQWSCYLWENKPETVSATTPTNTHLEGLALAVRELEWVSVTVSVLQSSLKLEVTSKNVLFSNFTLSIHSWGQKIRM